MDCTAQIKEYIENNYSDHRKTHTIGVAKVAKELARIYGADEKKAEIAALFHDMYRGITVERNNFYVNCLGLDQKYLDNCNLAHGKIAAIVMKRDFDIEDEEILNAVSFHTTGRVGMSLLEKIIYIADAIEPGRVYPNVEEIRKIAYEDIDKAVYKAMANTILYVEKRGNYLDEDTTKAKAYFEKMLKERKSANDK